MTATISSAHLPVVASTDSSPVAYPAYTGRRRGKPSVPAGLTKIKVLDLIDKHGWTRSDISHVCGVSRPTLHNILIGQAAVTTTVAAAIADIDPGTSDFRGIPANDLRRVSFIETCRRRAGVRQHQRHRSPEQIEKARIARESRMHKQQEKLTRARVREQANAAREQALRVGADPDDYDDTFHESMYLHRRFPANIDPLTADLPANIVALGMAADDDGDPEYWREQARCAQVDPEVFYPSKGGSNTHAKAICRRCPVRAQCLNHALLHGEHHGIWGGKSPYERARMLQEMGLRTVPEPRYFPPEHRRGHTFEAGIEVTIADDLEQKSQQEALTDFDVMMPEILDVTCDDEVDSTDLYM